MFNCNTILRIPSSVQAGFPWLLVGHVDASSSAGTGMNGSATQCSWNSFGSDDNKSVQV